MQCGGLRARARRARGSAAPQRRSTALSASVLQWRYSCSRLPVLLGLQCCAAADAACWCAQYMAAFLLASIILLAAAHCAAAIKPHVLLVLADDLGFGSASLSPAERVAPLYFFDHQAGCMPVGGSSYI